MQNTTPLNYNLIILGSGPAGCTAALYASRANLKPVLITGNTPGGQLITTTEVDNWPGEINGILGSKLMDNMLNHAKRFATEVITDQITSVDLTQKPFFIQGEASSYTCNALIIATGASARYLGLPSEKEFMGRGVSACATCDGFFYKGKKVAVVGGGSTAVEEALYLSEIASEVTLIHRRSQFKAEPILVEQLLSKVKENKIKIEWNSVVTEILGDEAGVNGIRIQNTQDKNSKDLAISGVFIAIGHKPNTEIFQKYLAMENGYLLVNNPNEYTTMTNIPGIFAAGDVADPTYRQAINAAASGCRAALDVQKYLFLAGG